MITGLDELLCHQIPATFDRVATSDHRFFDRNWFGCYAPDGSVGVITGIGAYANMNVLDGFAAVQHAGRQHNVRASRGLRPRIGETAAGPVRHEVVRALWEHRLVCEPAEGRSVSFDLVWEGVHAAHEEPSHVNRLDGRAYEDYVRFDQVGRVRGEVTIEGERIEAADWFGVRDHSWGIRRSVGGFEPFTGSLPPELHGMLFVWLEFAAGPWWGHVQVHEDGQGRRRLLEGFVARGDEPPSPVVEVAHRIDFRPGTRSYSRAALELTTAAGTTHRVEAAPLMTAWAYRGTGYDGGFDDGKGLGVYRGDVVEHDVYGVADPEEVVLPDGSAVRPIHREQPVRLTFDGGAGFGHFPIMPIALQVG